MVTIEALILEAKKAGASDIHIAVGMPPMMRVNGKLIDMDFPKLFVSDTEAIITTIMNKAQLDTLRSKGQIDFSSSIPQMGRYRVNVFMQRGSMAASIRLVLTEVPSVYDIGLPEAVAELYTSKRGLVLITGPNGSGKSTTIASIVDLINSNLVMHVITVEDPIEYLHNHKKSMVIQRELGLDTQTYAEAVKAALREDPDVIVIGELSDIDTIATAITAAETGHLVISSLHTNNAATTIERIIDSFPPHQQQQIRMQLSMVLKCIVSQQLIPTSDGKSRVAAFEVMFNNNRVRKLIKDGDLAEIYDIMEDDSLDNVKTMDAAVKELYENGLISKENALNYSSNTDI